MTGHESFDAFLIWPLSILFSALTTRPFGVSRVLLRLSLSTCVQCILMGLSETQCTHAMTAIFHCTRSMQTGAESFAEVSTDLNIHYSRAREFMWDIFCLHYNEATNSYTRVPHTHTLLRYYTKNLRYPNSLCTRVKFHFSNENTVRSEHN